MKHPTPKTPKMHKTKTISGITILLLIVIGGLFVFGVISPGDFLPGGSNGDGSGKEAATRVQRPNTTNNEIYRELMQKGDEAVFRGELSEALGLYQKASEEEPKEVGPYEKIGDIYFLQKKYDSAQRNFELAYSIKQTSRPLQIKIVQSLLGQRKVLNTRIELDKIEPPTQASLYYQGLISAFLNEQDKAKDFLTRSNQAGTDAEIKLNVERFLTVYRDFELTRDGKIENLQAMLAQAFNQAGEYGLAIEIGFNALKTKHDYRDVWIILGHAFLNEDKWLDAEDALQKAVDLDSSHPASYFFRGIAKRKLGKTQQAISDFKDALKYGWQPRILANQQLADIYFDLKNFETAFPLYKEIVMTDSAVIDRFIRPMALAINHLNLPGEAKALAEQAYKSHPNTAMAYNLLGWAALANGDFVTAHQQLQEAINQDPELEAAHLNLGQLAELEGDTDGALAHYMDAVELSKKSGNISIGNTASERYNELNKKKSADATPSTMPSSTSESLPVGPAMETQIETQNIPSLSLE